MDWLDPPPPEYERCPQGTPLSERFFDVPVNDITPFMLETPPDYDGIQVYLDLWISGDTLFIEDKDGVITASYPDLRYVAVMDTADNIVAIEPQALPFGPILPHLPPNVLTIYQQVTPGGQTFNNIIAPYQDEEAFYVILPLPGDEGELVGKMVLVFGPLAVDNDIRDSIFLLGSVVSGFLLGTSVVMGTRCSAGLRHGGWCGAYIVWMKRLRPGRMVIFRSSCVIYRLMS